MPTDIKTLQKVSMSLTITVLAPKEGGKANIITKRSKKMLLMLLQSPLRGSFLLSKTRILAMTWYLCLKQPDIAIKTHVCLLRLPLAQEITKIIRALIMM